MTKTRRSPAVTDRATSTTATVDASKSNGATDTFDYDQHIVDGVDRSIWAALFNGHFRLAVQCDVCGRWLTADSSKRAHRGPRCAARAVTP